MGSFIEKTAKTVDSAISEALAELNLSADDVAIEVLDEGESGGLLGFGKKPARIRVYYGDDGETDEHALEDEEDNELTELDSADQAVVKPQHDKAIAYVADEEDEQEEADIDNAENAALDYLQVVLSGLGMHGRISSWLDEEQNLHFEVEGEDLGAAIGRRGETLDAIQYLTNLVANSNTDNHIRVVVDIGGYRQRRDKKLSDMALRTAERALNENKKIRLKPMNPAERRKVHLALSSYQGITTWSEGYEPVRHIVIAPEGAEADSADEKADYWDGEFDDN
ncbi:MAG TPA: protein jag [Clostridiaceae bacterium]|nr:protein jag [Clostridiaceae bacterium]